MRYLYALLVATLLLGALSPTATVQADVPNIMLLADPTTVTIVGTLQSELGCAGDWNPGCSDTDLVFDTDDQVWQGSFTLPAGSWEYKAAMNGTWDESYGLNTGSGNIPLATGDSASVKFYFDYKTKWITDNVNSVIATAAGNFQSELGCPGDWQPDCLRSWLQDTDGDGIYIFVTTDLPAGNYEGKVALDEAWGTSYPASNIGFSVPTNGEKVTFSYNSATNAVSIKVGSEAGQDNDIWFDQLGHNSRDTLYRNPGGAVPAGTDVTLRLRAASGDLESARVRVWNDRLNTSTMYIMTRVATGVALANDPGPYEFWEVTLPASADPTVYWYRFIVTDGTKTAYYADDAARTGGWGEATADMVDYGYQLSIYDAAFTTPDWIKNAVVYQIFPDRFNNGDDANNPAAGEFFYGNNDTIFRSNDTEWNTVICDPRARPGAVAACEDKYSNNFYGGDLQGITEKITDGYFTDLGVTVLYLNPIFKSPSNHKYDTTDYGQIDPHFGTLADFEDMIDAANAENIHVVLDGVFNHVSSDSPYLDRYGRYPEVGACEDEDSPYRDWFYFEPAEPAGSGPCVGDDGTPGGADYESWWGYDSLPKLRANDTAVRQLIWDSTPGSPTAGIARYWIDQGASGWRLDVGGDVDPGTINDPDNDYWEGFRDAVHDSDPEGYIVGEEWGNAISWNLGGEWDATMNYQQSAAILSFWRDEAYQDNDFNTGSSGGPLNPITAENLNERLLNLKERYPAEAFAAMMNLFGSHDTNRALFLLNHDADQNDTALYANPAYDWSDSITRLKGAALLQMTLPGAPTIYYGDEIGLVGPVSYDGTRWQDDPYNRQPYPWLETGLGLPYYEHLQDDAPGSTRANLLAYYQTLTGTRNSVPALRTGSLDPLYAEAGSPVYIYGRKMADDSSAAIVAANKSETAEDVTINVAGYLPAGATLSDALSSATFTVEANGDLELTGIPAQGGYLLVLDAGFAGNRPATPNLVSAIAESGKVTLTWGAAAGADSYDIYRSVMSCGAYELLGNTTSLTYEDTTVINGKSYYYVIKAKNTALLESGFSNELSALPAYTVGWANLQWPPTISQDRSLVTASPNIYGKIWIDGATGGSTTPLPSVTAQVGYGDNGTLPTDASWRWFDASFNANDGDNDEYLGNLVLDAPAGDYDYLYRYSTDGGLTWVYGAYNSIFYSTLGSYDPANAGQLSITAPTDITAPAIPTGLALTGTTTDSISMTWDAHPNADGDLYGFGIWRKDTTAAEPSFTRVDLLADPLATSYSDTSVTGGHAYEYYITAIDESVNESGVSNIITATAEMRMVNVTFNVTVPNPTPGTVYIAGSLGDGYPSWNPGGVAMTNMGGGVWQVTLNLLDGSSVEYKYARGTWDKVEKQADGSTEVANRPLTVAYGTTGTQTVNDTVATWRDPIVSGFAPANGATEVAATAAITVNWSKPMADPIDPVGCFSVNGPSGPVTGTVTYNDATRQYTFTPTVELQGGAHTVTITGCKDASGNIQQVAQTWSFEVEANTASFTDVDASYWAYSWIERLYDAGITGGCGTSPLIYCPEDMVSRSQISIFLLRGIHGSAYTPPAASGDIFDDVDVSYWAAAWIERLMAEGITGGCNANLYCPEQPVTRAQMAVFLLRAKHGSSYAPPSVGSETGFSDVSVEHWAAAWIKQLAAEGITSGCSANNYCPEESVTRAQMAVFLVRTFNLP